MAAAAFDRNPSEIHARLDTVEALVKKTVFPCARNCGDVTLDGIFDLERLLSRGPRLKPRILEDVPCGLGGIVGQESLPRAPL